MKGSLSKSFKGVFFFSLVFLLSFSLHHKVKGSAETAITLHATTKDINVYPSLFILEDSKKTLTIDDVVSPEHAKQFIHSDQFEQQNGFFETAKWFRFEVHNASEQEEWLVELAYSLVEYIQFYSHDESGIVELEKGGSAYDFDHRKIKHRNFIFNFEIDPYATKTFYLLVHAQGDAHPPLNIWNVQKFHEKSQIEFILSGIFYGIAPIMVIYNLFLFFSLRMRSYLYYVLAITCAIITNLQNNGLGYQYIWPHSPEWNNISNPLFLVLSCIFILLFVRSFLDTDRYLPTFKPISYGLMLLNGIVIPFLFIKKTIAINIMLVSTAITFVIILTVAVICLLRGARQARFFIAGWSIYLIGIIITIFSTGGLFPYISLAEYAAQIALGIEVVLLSLALADKINLMRAEKQMAEKKLSES